MADQLDRDYELLTHNYHPYQTFTYELRNKYIRKENQDQEIREKGEQTLEDVYWQELKYLFFNPRNCVAEEEAKLGPGETVSLEKMTEILLRVSRAARAELGENEHTRNEDGEFNDFLEKRRPFLNPDNERASH